MSKAKKPNEVREEVRKQMAAKYKQEVESWKQDAYEHRKQVAKLREELSDVKDENARLKEQLAAQKDWIDRLMEFVNMPDSERQGAVKEYIEKRQMSEEFRELFSPYFDTLNRLNNILRW